MRNAKKIIALLAVVVFTSLLFVSCSKLKKNNDVVEIKAEKIVPEETDKVISAVLENKKEPESIIVDTLTPSEEVVRENKEDLNVAEPAKEKETVKADAEEAVSEMPAESSEVAVEETVLEKVESEEVSSSAEEEKPQIEQEAESVAEIVIENVIETVEEPIEVTIEAVEEQLPVAVEEVKEVEVAEKTESVEPEVFNPPVKAKEIPVKPKKEYSFGMEIGLGGGYYRLEYKDYRADMLKISIPVYLNIVKNGNFGFSLYVNPGYLKEIHRDSGSSAMIVDSKEKKQDYSIECGFGINTFTNRFSLRANVGLDIFNPGTKIDNPYTMFNVQLIPSFRLGNSKLWLAIPCEGSIKGSKHNAFSTGVYVTLRTDEVRK